MIMRQLHEGRADIEIAYARGVMPEGNPVALAAIDEVFETCSATWRGLGEIPGSGYRIREEFAQFDALKRFQPEIEPTINPKGCRCGDVLRGIMAPNECPLFRKVCTPENPVGPCMVSSGQLRRLLQVLLSEIKHIATLEGGAAQAAPPCVARRLTRDRRAEARRDQHRLRRPPPLKGD